MKKIGFIGMGNMGSALLKGIEESGLFASEAIYIADPCEDILKTYAQKGMHVYVQNKKVAACVDYCILCVKPQVLCKVIDEIKDELNENAIVISIAAGQTMQRIYGYFDKKINLVRVMPNTPALVKEGMSALTFGETIQAEDKEMILSIFKSIGKAEVVEEKLMDAVTAVSGSGPAYVFMMIEAMADGAVQQGMSRSLAYEFAAQTVLGASKMVLETGKHPGALKDMVCSPSGTTIDAVASLENDGFRAAIIHAIDVCAQKSEAMGK